MRTLCSVRMLCEWNKFPSAQLKVHQVRFEGKTKALQLLYVLAEGKVGGSRKQRMNWNFPHCTAVQEFLDAFAGMQKWCRFSITFLRVTVVLCIELEFKTRLTGTAWYGHEVPSQVQHLNWHRVCSVSPFVPCIFLQSIFYLWCTTKILIPKTFFFSFRVGTLSILKVEIIELFSLLFFFFYNFSLC